MSQGRALWGNEGRKAQESLAGGQTAAHQTSLLCPSFVSLLCTLTLGPVCVPRPLGFLKTCCTIKTSWWGSWTLRGKGGRPLGTSSLASEDERAVSAVMLALGGALSWRGPGHPPPASSSSHAHCGPCVVPCVRVDAHLLRGLQNSTYLSIERMLKGREAPSHAPGQPLPADSCFRPGTRWPWSRARAAGPPSTWNRDFVLRLTPRDICLATLELC